MVNDLVTGNLFFFLTTATESQHHGGVGDDDHLHFAFKKTKQTQSC